MSRFTSIGKNCIMLEAVLDSVDRLSEIRSSRSIGPAPTDRRDTADMSADRALFEAVAQALRNAGPASLRDLDIEICGGVVVLWGRVPRESFVPAEMRDAAYEDGPLPIGFGQTISTTNCRPRTSASLPSCR